MTLTLSKEDARRRLLSHLRLTTSEPGSHDAIRTLLAHLRCIQLDPLDTLGTNADLVVMARLTDVQRGDVYRALEAPHAFEHFAKERCLLPAGSFPFYRLQATRTPHWRTAERHRALPADLLDAVLEEVRRRGPLGSADLTERGHIAQAGPAGWKSTRRIAALALYVLWVQCRVTVVRRTGRGKLYDVPERALPDPEPREGYDRWGVLERVAAAGLLARSTGPTWSMLKAQRKTTVDAMLSDGSLREVLVEGSSRPFLTTEAFLEQAIEPRDDDLRILAPLDALLWDRKLVSQIFDFDYVWEVYKPAAKRLYGWYVVPLLHHGALVGRMQGHVDRSASSATLIIDDVWRESGRSVDVVALDHCPADHAARLGCDHFTRPHPDDFG